ncbi:autotransporter outer membrane beta-barrel domain-containing protein [Sphingomonas sp. R86520]|uniref:autotransporter outer membrane beta-barrel domain-containing protein n=1 Tax=Sphingomonas sp. R86520 TaxID=3093859 RepID=UPI0036D2EDD8
MKVGEMTSRTRRVRMRALQTSAMVAAVWVAEPAFAQCSPEPTVANSITTCAGTDVNGIRVTTAGTTVSVADSATVTNTASSPITIEVANTLPRIAETITISGQVAGGSESGITLLTGPVSTYIDSTTQLALSVTNGATLSGTTALTMGQTPGNVYGMLIATLDNAGTITGSSGIALRGDVASTTNGFTTSRSSFTSITNQATGTISGSIVGPVGMLKNAGLIDGGSNSALTTGNAGSSYPYTISPGTWTNTGTIRSNSSAATIVSSSIGTLISSGTIANFGAGAALASSSLIVQNQAGGLISSSGTTAINGTGYLNLVNRGTITGNVVTGNSSSMIDSSQGRINGSVVFGSGYDTLVVRYDGTATPVTGITGTVDAGGGINTQQIAIGSDTTIATPVTLLTGFQQLAIATDQGVTTTLGAGFVTPTTIQVIGGGTLVNRAAIVTSGTAFANAQVFTNEGSIQTGSGSAYAITAGSGYSSQITNNGAINSAGNGISSSQARIVNTGTLTVFGTGVSIFGNSLTNSGTIRSTAGIGAQLSGNVGTLSTNSGTIQGAQIGVQTSAYLSNTGSITASNRNGVAVQLDAYGVVFNNAGGVIGSGGQAITGTSFNESVVNAGTINGRVSLTGDYQSAGSQRYISQTGGVLNGDLVLGSGGLLFTDLANTGPGLFAGITGSVTAADGALLRYRVTGTQSAVLTPVGPFASAAFELTDGAALTLTAPTTVTRQVLLAGSGSVDLDANLATTTSTSALAVSSILATQASYGSPTGTLAISSRGTITVTRAAGSSAGSGVGVSLGSDDSFTNFGTITVTDRNAFSGSTGITGGFASSGSVTNAGSILLDGGIGISGANVINTGLITQVDGGAAARGVLGGTLDNRGTIRVAGVAVSAYNGGKIVNSGMLASTGGIAISGTDTSASATITNASGGTISGTGGTAVQLYYGTFTNAGAVNGTVDMGYGYPYYSGAPTRSYASSTFVAAGGTIAGDLLFGDSSDLLLQTGDSLGVSGIVDGGEGRDIYGRILTSSATVAIDFTAVRNFEDGLIQAVGNDTVVTVTAPATLAGDLYVAGNGSIVNQAMIEGRMTTMLPYSLSSPFTPNPLFPTDQTLASITNAGSIDGGAFVTTASLTNSGTIGTSALAGNAVSIQQGAALAFNNSGAIDNDGSSDAVSLYATGMTFTNSGRISGGTNGTAAYLASNYGGSIAAANTGTLVGAFSASSYPSYWLDDAAPSSVSVALVNGGTITAARTAVSLLVDSGISAGSASLDNSGTIEATGDFGIGAVLSTASAATQTLNVTNAGTIRANGDGGIALLLTADAPAAAMVVNTSSGLIEATGKDATAIISYNAGLDLTNAGTIRGGTVVADSPANFAAGAIQTIGSESDRIVNTGTILGSIDLSSGDDEVENRGRIEGNVFLGAGDDTFLQRADAVLIGTVDAGEGNDGLIVDATVGGAVNGDQFINFERFTQIGTGNVAYSGTFRFDTIGVSDGNVTIAAGQVLSSAGAVVITGGAGAETVTNAGTIAGSIDLGAGNDSVINTGTIQGAVFLGAGNDRFVEGLGSTVAGGVDGGTGDDLYTVMLAGNRSGIGQRSNFERLNVEGSGTLALTLDQNFQSVALAGTGLNVALGGFAIGAVTGSDAAETLSVDGDIGMVSLGAGNDELALGTTRAAGLYAGGAGTDLLRFMANAPVTLAGTATGFERVALTGGVLSVTGTLGSNVAPLTFGDGAQSVTVAAGGTLAGMIDLGAGNDSFRLAIGGTLTGTVSGGAGTDTATFELAGDRTLGNDMLRDFEILNSEGNGTLTLTGAQTYERLNAVANLTVGPGASLTAPVVFGAGNNRFTIAGTFAGSVDGGAGTDTVLVAGGSAAAPVAFGSIANVEAFGMTAGYATIAGTASFGTVDMSGGRLVGLAGSMIRAPQIAVRSGATFGSAGSVVGDIAVAGTLSPGASPGTMTVTGNVSLANGSVSLFEITPTVADKLVINGGLSIASGATLRIVADGVVRAGTSYDLIVASGGITGSYTTIDKAASVFGFVVQRADRIQLLGQFLGDAAFSPQVARSIDYANTAIQVQPATSALFAVLPTLLTASGASNPLAFAQLTPEPYASATQMGVDQALSLADVARGPGFATTDREDVGVFTFAQGVGQWHTLGADRDAGTSKARSSGYGFLGGIGIGNHDWSVGAFAGYLDSRQRITTLGATTSTDGVVAGVHGRYAAGSVRLGASVLYDGGDARTMRSLPGASTAAGRYGLHSWAGDLTIGYAAAMTGDWTVTPKVGVTYIRTTRGRVSEDGGPFALTVMRDRQVTGFADVGATLARDETSDAAFRPYVGFGARARIEGKRADATASYAGAPLTFTALGAPRSQVVGTASAGVAYRLPSGVELFSSVEAQTGRDDHRESISTGVRLRF